MSEYLQVATSIETQEGALGIARAVVERRLAACAQVLGPIQSVYWWKDEIETAEEWLCVMKTRRALYDSLEAAITELHAYDVPEIIATPIAAGSHGYLDWIDATLGGKDD
jgi:periplasmic divalent cation tolerance protein